MMVLVTVVSGCGRTAPPSRRAKVVSVLAASSLTDSFTSLGRQFEALHPGVDMKFQFGASSTLARQIVDGNGGDVFASADEATMKLVTDVAETPVVFARNALEIAVARGRESKIRSVGDLGRPGITLALCQATVPCGRLADAALRLGASRSGP